MIEIDKTAKICPVSINIAVIIFISTVFIFLAACISPEIRADEMTLRGFTGSKDNLVATIYFEGSIETIASGESLNGIILEGRDQDSLIFSSGDISFKLTPGETIEKDEITSPETEEKGDYKTGNGKEDLREEVQSYEYKGRGNAEFSFDPPAVPYLLEVEGNFSETWFSVRGLDEEDRLVEFFVSVAQRHYHGTVIGFREEVERLQILADGDWGINIFTPKYADKISVPGEKEGSGDQVLRLDSLPEEIFVEGNQIETNFIVTGFGAEFSRRETYVNALERVQKRKQPEIDLKYIQIRAADDWYLKIN